MDHKKKTSKMHYQKSGMDAYCVAIQALFDGMILYRYVGGRGGDLAVMLRKAETRPKLWSPMSHSNEFNLHF